MLKRAIWLLGLAGFVLTIQSPAADAQSAQYQQQYNQLQQQRQQMYQRQQQQQRFQMQQNQRLQFQRQQQARQLQLQRQQQIQQRTRVRHPNLRQRTVNPRYQPTYRRVGPSLNFPGRPTLRNTYAPRNLGGVAQHYQNRTTRTYNRHQPFSGTVAKRVLGGLPGQIIQRGLFNSACAPSTTHDCNGNPRVGIRPFQGPSQDWSTYTLPR